MKYLLLAFTLFCGPISAAVITPVSVDASSTFNSYDSGDLINDSGLNLLGQHDTNYSNQWMSNESGTNPSLTFNLGGVYSLSSSSVWQYNAICCGLDRGVKTFDIFSSTDGINFTFIADAALAKSLGGLINAQTVSFHAIAQFIRFDITSNYGDIGYTGLSEVKFNGDVSAVPIPAAAFMFAPALLGFMGLRRKTKTHQ